MLANAHASGGYRRSCPSPCPAAFGRLFVAIPLASLYTNIRYAVIPCADTAHTPERVKELAAMRRFIVLLLLALLCLMLRASSRI